MAKERLDRILLRKGLVTEDQIKQALLRQKSHRGPLGSHLLYYKFITEKDLVLALALGEQFGVPGVALGNREISPQVIQKVPAAVADEHMVCPFAASQLPQHVGQMPSLHTTLLAPIPLQ